MTGAILGVLFSMTSAASPESPRVAEGRWGGTGVALDVTSSGARIELDCAHGTIDSPLVLVGEGGFDLSGTLVRERPGPVRMDEEEEKGLAVRYVGRLDGDTLELRVVLPNAPRPPGPLTARLGQAPRLRKCG